MVLGFGKEKSFYERVKQNIKVVREQGTPPRLDISSLDSLDEYMCDLCKVSSKRSGLVQCSFCGRWACEDKCIVKEEGSCTNCGAIIKLLRESIEMELRAREQKKVQTVQKVQQKRSQREDERRRSDELDMANFQKKKKKLEQKKELTRLKREVKEEKIMPSNSGSTMLNVIEKMKKLKDGKLKKDEG